MSSCCSTRPAPVIERRGRRFDTTCSPQWVWFRLALAMLLAGLSMSVSLALNIDPPEGLTKAVAHLALASLAFLGLAVLGWPILRASLVPRLTLEHLYLVGLGGAFTASVYSSVSGIGHIYYEVVLILLAIYHLGQLVLGSASDKAADLAQHIPGLRSTARIIGDGPPRNIPADQVVPGQRLRIEAGSIIPADGVVARGRAFIEELAHTGEPFPAARKSGDAVLAGARVLDGAIEVEATKAGDDRELDRLLAACQDSAPGPSEQLARRVLGWFVPAVIIVALATGIYWGLIRGQTAEALFNALAVTIVACPCALGLAVPLAVRRALARMRLNGVLPQVPDLIERLAAVDTVVFDKTGTLSHPRLGLDELRTTASAPPELAGWLAAIQRRSTHPVARPFWTLDDPADLHGLRIELLPGAGIEAHFREGGVERCLGIGNDSLINDASPVQKDPPGRRRLHILLDGELIATATLAESPRRVAVATLQQFRRSGMSGVLLTGDTWCPPAYREELDQCQTAMSAAGKAAWIDARQAAGHRVLFIGDGLNDTEALRRSHAGIALGSGAVAAAAAADAVLTHDDLSVLAVAAGIAKATHRQLTRLLAFSLSYNLVGISLAATGILHPVAAALLMLASSATVLGAVNGRHWLASERRPMPKPLAEGTPVVTREGDRSDAPCCATRAPGEGVALEAR